MVSYWAEAGRLLNVCRVRLLRLTSGSPHPSACLSGPRACPSRSLGNFKSNSILLHRWVIYPFKPFLTLFNWGVPDMTGYIMSFCTSHFSPILLIGQFWRKTGRLRPFQSVFMPFYWQCQLLSVARPQPASPPARIQVPLLDNSGSLNAYDVSKGY